MGKYCVLFLLGLAAVISAVDPLVEPAPNPDIAIDPPPKKPEVLCPRNMCRMFCQRGFKLDSNGCPVCECVEDPCEDHQCGPMEVCEVENHCTGFPCRSMKAVCTVKPMCAMPMCENFCPEGYHHDKFGCMTCECNSGKDSEICQHHKCPIAHKCVAVKPQFCEGVCEKMAHCLPYGQPKDFHPTPTPKPVFIERKTPLEAIEEEVPEGIYLPCLFHTELRNSMRKAAQQQLANNTMLGRIMQSMAMRVPACDDNGHFKPIQCHLFERSCWCVNDRGLPIPDSRVNIKKKEDIPKCAWHRTKLVKGSFMLAHELEDVHPHLDKISNLVHEHLAKILKIDHAQIIITQIKPSGTKQKVLEVHFTLQRNNENELSHVELSLMWHFDKNRSILNYLNGKLTPQPNTLKIDHETEVTDEIEEHMPEHGLWSHNKKGMNDFVRFYHKHKALVIVGSVSGIVFLVAAIAVIVTLCKRGTVTSNHFRHKRLSEKSKNYKQNLAFANWMEGNQNEKKVSEEETENKTVET